MQMIYSRLAGGEPGGSVLAEAEDYHNIGGDEVYLDKAVKGTGERMPEYDIIISRLSPKRALERIPLVDRANLHLAMHELDTKDATQEVIINEAVELAKRFGDETDSRFINGVLGSLIRERQ